MGACVSECFRGISKANRQSLLRIGPNEPCAACGATGMIGGDMCDACSGLRQIPVGGWEAAAQKARMMMQPQPQPGRIPGAQPMMPAMMPGMPGMPGGMPGVVIQQGMQPCFKCQGRGFCHTSNMNHNKGPNEKCMFCDTCDGCGGCGAIQGGQAVMPGMPGCGMMGGGGIVIQEGMRPCYKCHGHGFCHDSPMPHDKGPDEKCFFCEKCDGCGGSGAIQGGQTAMMPGGFMGGGIVIQPGMQMCFKCRGHGFTHFRSIDHDKPMGERCFFCQDCDACGGRGCR
eukprot:TRINITY_DN4878_c0_g2_i1.p1 TRINITY_DN4878_c0_g2~~TRINITY_DN4878_c0_g2_i1.p1  ORF type:complete len:284 (+),score=21.21 TRINITY_DN4878_c0_g2_i1:75-926(+)